jgi:hypothetical protein
MRLREQALSYFHFLCTSHRVVCAILDARVVHPVDHAALYHSLIAFETELYKFLRVDSNAFYAYHRIMRCYLPKIEELKVRYWDFKKWYHNLVSMLFQEEIDMGSVLRRMQAARAARLGNGSSGGSR